ncbi:MAG: GTP cyclohydrolase I FolE2 [Neisseriaceae bacterium]|jgi:GTP cyclohydrolase I|nr:MAG: GTP cyclohydrolase I FolE2 [Neisseriaceae bacterium]
MNAPYDLQLPDVQSQQLEHGLAIDEVGVKDVRYPIRIRTANGEVQHSIAFFDMYVSLPPSDKGTHMSRFIEMLETFDDSFSLENFQQWLARMVQRLEAEQGMVSASFPYFISKQAPVSGVSSLMDYEVKLVGQFHHLRGHQLQINVQVPVTSLCPCSKQISAYGAHNQRSHISIRANARTGLNIESLIQIAEQSASCELWGLLKRPDEKFVTERAYENPKFVEDLVRDIAHRLMDDPRVGSFEVSSENFESIHNHSAFARIRHAKP